MIFINWRKRLVAAGFAAALLFSSPALAGTFSAATKSDLDLIEAKVRAAQFLSRTTFGPTKDEIQSLADRIQQIGARDAFEEWIDAQFLLPMTSHHALAKTMILEDGWPTYITTGMSTTVYRHYAWWEAAIAAPDQLRQRMAWALAQIFVINDFNGIFNSRSIDASGEPRYLGVVNYYDMLVANAFGNYRDTLEDVSRHPVMGIFLSHLGNRAADPVAGTFPDENYAREIQQLLSIGLYEIKRNGDYVTDKNKDPIPSYDNDDIVSFSRVFTGLNYAGGSLNFHAPMEMVESWHDTDEKELHNGTILPAGQNGDQDLTDAHDNLFYHSNTAPFIARLLIQRLVKSNPTSRYIDAVAAAFNDNGNGVRGDFMAVIKEIYLNNEAMESYSYTTKRKPYRLVVEGNGTEHSRLQEPVLRYAALVRAFDGASTHPNGRYSIPDRSYWLNQAPYRSPSIFNFYLPNHVPGGELQDYRPKGRVPNRTVYAPEFQILTAVAANRIANIFRSDVRDAELDLSVRRYDQATSTYGNVAFQILLDFSEETALADDQEALLEHLDILLCHGSMSDTARDNLAGIVEAATTNPEERAKGAVLALLTAPDCAVHE